MVSGIDTGSHRLRKRVLIQAHNLLLGKMEE